MKSAVHNPFSEHNSLFSGFCNVRIISAFDNETGILFLLILLITDCMHILQSYTYRCILPPSDLSCETETIKWQYNKAQMKEEREILQRFCCQNSRYILIPYGDTVVRSHRLDCCFLCVLLSD